MTKVTSDMQFACLFCACNLHAAATRCGLTRQARQARGGFLGHFGVYFGSILGSKMCEQSRVVSMSHFDLPKVNCCVLFILRTLIWKRLYSEFEDFSIFLRIALNDVLGVNLYQFHVLRTDHRAGGSTKAQNLECNTQYVQHS